MAVINNIKNLRIERGLTQDALGKLVPPNGVTQGTIAQWEKSERLNMETIRRLSEALNCRIHDILCEEADVESWKTDYSEIDNEISALKKSLNNDSLSDPERHELKQTIDDLKEDKARIRFDLQMFGMDPEASDDEILDPFHKLNSTGKRVAVERVQELTEIPRYKKEK